MIEAARRLSSLEPRPQFVAAMANEKVMTLFQDAMDRLNFGDIKLVSNAPRTVIAAADAVICASGTAALETMLINRPMVVTYRVSAATYFLAKYLRLIKPQLFSLPNILAGEKLVPELIQDEASGENLARETRRWLEDNSSRTSLHKRFLGIHQDLRCDASQQAADAVCGLLER
jgi:lipid-A-disaccharide synthase